MKASKMITSWSSLTVLAATALCVWPAQAEENLKIGLIATLSGPPAVIGQPARSETV